MVDKFVRFWWPMVMKAFGADGATWDVGVVFWWSLCTPVPGEGRFETWQNL